VLCDPRQQPTEDVVLLDHADIEGPFGPELLEVALGDHAGSRGASVTLTRRPQRINRRPPLGPCGSRARDAGRDACSAGGDQVRSVATECFDDVAEALEDSSVPEAVAVVDEGEGIVLVEVGIGDLSRVADAASESWVIESIDHGPRCVGKAKSGPVVPLGSWFPSSGRIRTRERPNRRGRGG
jgi:hypothetical protein